MLFLNRTHYHYDHAHTPKCNVSHDHADNADDDNGGDVTDPFLKSDGRLYIASPSDQDVGF